MAVIKCKQIRLHLYAIFCPALCWWFSFVPFNITQLIRNKDAHMGMCNVWHNKYDFTVIKVITNWVLLGPFSFFLLAVECTALTGSFILKIAAESATLKSFHFSLASLLWLQLLRYLDIVQAKQAQQTSDSPEELEWMQPNSDPCHFVFCISTPSPRMCPFNEWGNTAPHANP